MAQSYLAVAALLNEWIQLQLKDCPFAYNNIVIDRSFAKKSDVQSYAYDYVWMRAVARSSATIFATAVSSSMKALMNLPKKIFGIVLFSSKTRLVGTDYVSNLRNAEEGVGWTNFII